ncbi:MAG TPA: hypothetical protein VGR35_18105 [Tepidisphaeraceae bacterium]|nr:hypothetical protein [Tepidisphaeraceae bacterium]
MTRNPRPAAPVILLLSLLCLLVVGAREVPSPDQMRQLISDKQYKRALREIARAMQLKGDDAAAYDRGELLLIRADAQLGMRIEPAAAKSYRDAAEAATTDDDRAMARSMALLISKSERLAYSPRTGDAGRKIDIVTDRQAALDALLADELAVAEPKLRAAKEARKIPDVLDAAGAVEAVRFIERAATGATAHTDEMMKALVARIETLLDDALIELDGKADAIEAHALGLIVVPQEVRPGQGPPTTIKVKKRGLSPADEAGLKEVMETCREIVSRNRDVAVQLGAEPDRFRRASDFAIRLSSKAGAILRADYTGIQERPIGDPAAAPPQKERVEKGTLPG